MPGRAPSFFQRYPKTTLFAVILVASVLLIIAVEAALNARYEGLKRDQHAYLKILDGPLYEGVPGTAEIRDIWAGVEGSNACGPDRLDVRYADYYLYAPAPFCNEHLAIDERYGERATVNPEDAEIEIWAFGGSTILDVGAVDADTIPSQLSARLNELSSPGVRVRNFGVTGFQSTLERTRFFEILRAEPEPPDIVLFYDGFNEAAHSQASRPGALGGGLASKVEALVEKRHGRSLRYVIGGYLSRFYTFQEVLLPAWRSLRGGSGAAQVEPPGDEIEKRIDAAVETYIHNLRMARAVASEYGIDAHFFWQPMLFTRPSLGPNEGPHLSDDWVDFWDPVFQGFYSRMLDDERLREAGDFHDLTAVFDATRGDVFRDYGHLLPRGNAIVAEAMAEILIGSAAFQLEPEDS